MTKQSGLGDGFWVDGVDLSGDIGSLGTVRGGPAALDLTGINKSAHERLGGLRDGAMAYSSWFNDAAGQSHPTHKTLPTTDRIMTYLRGTSIGSAAANLNAKQVNYDGQRQQSGELALAVDGQGNQYGLEWGDLNTGKRTDTGATNGAGQDFGAATAFGLQAYLHVFAFTGTSVTIKIQESSDNGGGDAYADVVGGTFTVVSSAPQAQSIQTTRTLAVERWLRVVTTGVFNPVTFGVIICKNATEVNF